LFITGFYGVLDPKEGTLIYANAGHNPPFMLKPRDESKVFALARTGMPIGIEMEAAWERRTVSFTAGDKLILYTDGITEAQNIDGGFYNETLLVETIMNSCNNNAFQIQDEILKKVKQFSQGAPQYDDITLMILEKESEDL
jgi:serine phosphatase RsbU (regulator of sigma subunit)